MDLALPDPTPSVLKCVDLDGASTHLFNVIVSLAGEDNKKTVMKSCNRPLA